MSGVCLALGAIALVCAFILFLDIWARYRSGDLLKNLDDEYTAPEKPSLRLVQRDADP
jgi:hypothetical protein